MTNKIDGRRILVTGGAGFIGSHVVDQLLNLEAKVTVLDNLINGRMENLQQHQDNPNFSFIKDTILNSEVVDYLARDTDIIINMATLGVRHSILFPIENHRINSEGTIILLEAARRNNIQRFVQVSSSEVYGTAISIPQDENHRTYPHTIYGASKLSGDAYARAYFLTFKFPTVVVRPFNTYGPRAHHEKFAGEFIPKSILRALNGLPILIFGDGQQSRDYSYVTDISEAIVQCCIKPSVIGRTVNIGTNKEIKIADIARMIQNILGEHTVQIEYQKDRPGDVFKLVADYSNAQKLIDYSPSLPFEEGLRLTLDWFKSQDYKKMIKEESGRNWE